MLAPTGLTQVLKVSALLSIRVKLIVLMLRHPASMKPRQLSIVWSPLVSRLGQVRLVMCMLWCVIPLLQVGLTL